MTMRTFHLTDEEEAKVQEFSKAQDEKRGSSYYGAVGGGLTYSFTPTGLGCIVVIKHESTGAELDLTDIDNW